MARLKNYDKAFVHAIGRRLMTLRKEHGLLQREVAEKSGVCLATINQSESGQVMPSVFTLAKLAKVYETTIDNIINNNQ